MRTDPPVEVLLVDDEVDFAVATAERLARRGLRATCAHSGRAALAALAAGPCDVVVVDLRMPGMGGLDLLRELHRARPALPVIVLTGHGTASAGVEGMKLGAADFLQKPIGIETLADAIRAAAARGRAVGSGPGEEPVDV